LDTYSDQAAAENRLLDMIRTSIPAAPRLRTAAMVPPAAADARSTEMFGFTNTGRPALYEGEFGESRDSAILRLRQRHARVKYSNLNRQYQLFKKFWKIQIFTD